MKVLHISAGNMYGGIETVLVTMARERRECPELKPHFSVCFEDRFSRELRATGAPVDYLGNVRVRNPLTVLRARAALDRLLSQESIDAAICHSPWAHSIFGPVVQSHRIPLVFWSHGFVTGRHWLEAWARRIVPALVICNSRATEASVKSLFPQVPSQVVYAPVSNSAHVRVPRQDDSSQESSPVVIIQVSRMEKWKGHGMMLQALDRLKDLPDWVCWVVGGAQNDTESSYEQSLRRLAMSLGVSDRVHFLGSRDDVPALLTEADVFCQPNISPEPFGIVFIEALQAGIPVVSSKLGGAMEIIDSDCGVLVPAGEPEPLASALRDLIENPTKRIQMGLVGQDRARNLCDPARQLGKLREVLQSLF
jgi:glycosyltransferase involved in cell wall biosynthesis